MIVRKWKCRVPRDHREGFLKHLDNTGIRDAAALPGYLGAQVFERERGVFVELTLLTYWESYDYIRQFAGDNIAVAKLYPEDDAYRIDPDREVTHFTVVRHQFVDSCQPL
ncbi:hypothetical protein [Desulfovibrio inopinatus]|uniref:hypothetical protein n=1 Tax=Desulfovibrio inopinatus TaxID=102109 RepID=UPI0004068282|nr:hypothetical protein [Desulfovibrio inopinatus]